MTDLEITRLCAEAMGILLDKATVHGKQRGWYLAHSCADYKPLHDDAQAMALVKRFRLEIYCDPEHNNLWLCNEYQGDASMNSDLNRAICLAVAKMQAAQYACEHLPEWCEVTLFMERGAGWISWSDEYSNEYDVEPNDDSLAEQIIRATDAARKESRNGK